MKTESRVQPIRQIAQDQKGFTLAEVTIAMFIASLTLATILFANLNIQKVNANAYQRVIALQDAHQVIEQIREAATYGFFPNNALSSFPNASEVGGYSNLTNEEIFVNYASVTADPLDVTITVNWTDDQQRNVTYNLNTLITQRE